MANSECDATGHAGIGEWCTRDCVWSPARHSSLAFRHGKFHQDVMQLLLVRYVSGRGKQTTNVPWLPNELMFEIFGALFCLYHVQGAGVD